MRTLYGDKDFYGNPDDGNTNFNKKHKFMLNEAYDIVLFTEYHIKLILLLVEFYVTVMSNYFYL